MAGAEAAMRGGAARSDLATRALVGTALAAVALAGLWAGGAILWLFVAAVALVAVDEWARLVHVGQVRRLVAIGGLALGLLLAAPFVWGPERTSVAMLVSIAVMMLLTVGGARAAAGLAYIGLAAIGLLYLREQPNGPALALWTLIVVILTDTGAYFAGRAIGGPKLAPAISPSKTWAGVVGGMIAALIGGALVGHLAELPPAMLWLGAPLAAVAQAGDLFESALKRRAGVKDSGALLPGHGGVLDRIDGAMPVVILVAALVAAGTL